MLYTRKGDKGQTILFGCNQKMVKSSALAAALGSVDEINSFLGLCKVKAEDLEARLPSGSLASVVADIQQNLFTIQAELAGAPKTIGERKVKEVEKMVDDIEKELPPIKSFLVSGGTELSALFDYARTVARRAERRVVAVAEKLAREPTGRQIGEHTRAYLNRLSSLLYALARLMNARSGIKEEWPRYE